jgi:ketosteroid isomerase-like protein
MTRPKVRAEEASPVLAANQEFYRAFRGRDLPAMDRLWAASVEVVCVHPGWEALTSRKEIIESWRGILESAGAPPIRCQEESVRFVAEAAVVVCIEMIGERALVATNVFVHEDGAWRIALHHATPTARNAPSRGTAATKTVH